MTDALYRIVAIKFREPLEKKFVFYKPFKSLSGFFGHTLFPCVRWGEKEKIRDELLVVEGEFNQLQLQSLMVRVAEARGISPDTMYQYVCAVGGVQNADWRTIQRLDPLPTVCYDNDASGAGFQLVEKARDILAVRSFTTPKVKDLDEFIRSFGGDHEAAHRAFVELRATAKFHYRDYEGLAAEISGIRKKQIKEFEVHNQAATIITADLMERGKLYNDGAQSYIFLKEEKKLIVVDPDNLDLRLLLKRYGLNPTERIFKFVVVDLHMAAFRIGEETEVHKLAYYNPTTRTLYLFNNGNQIYRISPDESIPYELVDNGTDGVLFLANSKAKPFDASLPAEAESLVDKYLAAGISAESAKLLAEYQRLIFLLWFYSMFFGTILPTKPILVLLGEKGSGKTCALRKIGKLLFGDNFEVTPMPNKAEDFDTAVTNSHYMVLDNVDTEVDWLNDRLSVVATGASIKKRALYSNNELLDIPARCFLALATRDPKFKRDDVADRLVILHLKRIDSFQAEADLIGEVVQNRDRIMSEVVRHLHSIVLALKDEKKVQTNNFRMADFASFVLKIGVRAGVRDQLESILTMLGNRQSAFTLDDDPIFGLLETWIANNRGKRVTNKELYDELRQGMSGNYFPCKNLRSFSQYMRNLRPNMADFYNITESGGGGGEKYWMFSPKD